MVKVKVIFVEVNQWKQNFNCLFYLLSPWWYQVIFFC